MDIGQKLRQARQEAGLSQRQLCGQTITRNMLSQIENGSARPSMDTLRYLAERLGKPISFFLEEQAVVSLNQRLMEAAREAFTQGRLQDVLGVLEGYRGPDPSFDQEKSLLRALARLDMARKALGEGRLPYAAALLEQAGQDGGAYWRPALERERLLLLAQAQPERAAALLDALPGDDRELLLRAEAALAGGDAERSGRFLDAALDQRSPTWNLLRGRVHLALGELEQAAACLHRAEETAPDRTAPLLEQCYRELGDYKTAYFYARKQIR